MGQNRFMNLYSFYNVVMESLALVLGEWYQGSFASALESKITTRKKETLCRNHLTPLDLVFPTIIIWIFELTCGQPWLVNALGRELCFEEQAIDWKQTVHKVDVERAAEILIKRRDVHLDQLADKLTEPRVARIIESILIGEDEVARLDETRSNLNEDRQYLIDLGLVRSGERGLEIANPIYREIIPRELTAYRQEMLGINPQWYIKTDGKLDIEKVLAAYIEFYKEHSELVTKRRTYTEAAHHLLFMAWLQRIANSGGHIFAIPYFSMTYNNHIRSAIIVSERRA